MPKFAANLSMLFTELPFLERFAAAARAGFEAVEFLFPYEYAAGEIRQRLQENQLQLVLFNTPPGDVNAGEWGLAAIPGRSAEAYAILSWRWSMPASSVARRCISWPAWCRRERIAQPARPCLSIICATPRSALPATTSGYSSKR